STCVQPQLTAVWTLLLAACLVNAPVASAQPTAPPVSGVVTSSDGARLPHAQLTATEVASGRQTRGSSDHLGAFLLDRLTPGTYTIRVACPGFAPRTIDNVVVGDATIRPLAITLEPAGMHEVVTVSEGLPRDSVEITAVRESAARDVGELLS